MARFEQLVVSNQRDRYGIPRATGHIIVNLDEITTVDDATVDLTYRSFFDAAPAGVYPGVRIALRDGQEHTLMLGQFNDVDEADTEVNRFAQWLTGAPLLT